MRRSGLPCLVHRNAQKYVVGAIERAITDALGEQARRIEAAERVCALAEESHREGEALRLDVVDALAAWMAATIAEKKAARRAKVGGG